MSRHLVPRAAHAVAVVLCISLTIAFASASTAKLTGDLPRVMQEAGSDELIPVSIVLEDQLTGVKLRAIGESESDVDTRRALRIAALKSFAATKQVRVRGLLDEAALIGNARNIRPLWIGNVVGAELTKHEINRLASLVDVARINWNPKRDISLGPKLCPLPPQQTWLERLAPAGIDAEIECGVDLMRAPEVWDELGNTGEGAVVAVVDSGVCWTHTDIVNQIWVNPGEDLDGDGAVMDPDDENGIDDDGNGFVDDLIGWNFEVGTNAPNDTNSHGSHCAGTVAGDGTAGFQAGMAPDAKIMVVKVGLTFSDEVDVWNGMQYASENGADAISMSLGWPHNQNPDRATWRTNAENAIDLGTAMVIAAGNEGQGNEPDNVRTPGDVPRVITVGATDCSDGAASFSSRGPVTWQDVPGFGDHPYPPGLVKPDVSAPGVSTRSHSTCSGYSYKSGTSMATPHVAGAVALMRSANAGLTHDDIKLLLEDTSIDLGAAGKDNTYGTGRVDAYEAVLSSATPDGRISIKQNKVACSSTLDVTVSDLDLEGTGSVSVEIVSDTETLPEIVTLTETSPSSAVFKGSIEVAEGEPAADGILQVGDGDLITGTYIDADDGQGGINVPKTDSATVDCTKPLISNVRDEDITLRGATIRWTTDESSDSVVYYGETLPPATEDRGNANTTDHVVDLSGLEECTIYYYEVQSADAQGNLAIDDNGGQYYYFETLGDFGEGPVSCHRGNVNVVSEVYSCSDVVTVRLSDLDLNTDSGSEQTVSIELTSSTEHQPELVLLTETGANTSTFEGTIATAGGTPQPDGVLQLSEGDVITATYRDVDDGTGAPALSYDTALADCAEPRFRDITVDTITDQRATIRWKSDEPSDATLEWGPTPALGESVVIGGLSTSHAVTLKESSACGALYFRISGSDEFGYVGVADAGGTPFSFNAGMVPGLYWMDDFESDTSGWTLEGEWEIGEAQGLGGSSGRSDPVEAYNRAGVLGHDLSGQGAYPGDYEPGANESAWTPTLDASSWSNTKLIYHKNLHSGVEDDAQLRVWLVAGHTLYRSDRELVNDADYGYTSIDLAEYVDGQPSVRFQFLQIANESGQYSGWTIDDFIIKDGSLPDYGACTDCGGAPSFAGATSAFDNDACGSAGVTVTWNEAVAWGTGEGGTYTLYRGESPDFVPSPSNLVASGITGLSHVDNGAPSDRELWYVVRAESDESCASGPANGGMMDENLVRVRVLESTAQPTPGAVSAVEVSLIGGAHVQLSWAAATSAGSYNIYRSTLPDGSDRVLVGETNDLFFEDRHSGANKTTYFYDVVAVNACGVEGP